MESESTLLPTLRLSFEMTQVLADLERTGIQIDPVKLAEIESEYLKEFNELSVRLQRMAEQAMGDTPINLSSADDRSMLFYSRKVKNKSLWASTFNLGSELRGHTRKPKQRARMSKKDFARAVKEQTEILYKTIASRCLTCKGSGRVQSVKKDGTAGKAVRVCKPCGGAGIIYANSAEIAGFKIIPRDAWDTASAGFKTDHDTLSERVIELRGDAREFSEAYTRYNALRTYLSTFVNGLKNNKDENDIVHPDFMQCVTATGRLSSRNPNFQNMPRGSTFAIRKAVVSRFPGGNILEADYAQLEFRVAGYLSNDPNIYFDVEARTDVHTVTADIIGCSRQEAKAHTFKPLYGGTTGTPEQQRYYRAFKDKYSGVAEWHERLQRDAVTKGKIVLPSGREYSFPGTKWTEWGTATNRTSICNYPVQGFATGDLLPIALVYLHKNMKKHKTQSLICNTVHDSIVLDVFPGEEELVVELVAEAMLCLPSECQRRYGIVYDMPIGLEIKMGPNWLETREVYKV
jgi:DNA polymerase I-like protein with 3'-5' exonuclease and polymerase domains